MPPTTHGETGRAIDAWTYVAPPLGHLRQGRGSIKLRGSIGDPGEQVAPRRHARAKSLENFLLQCQGLLRCRGNALVERCELCRHETHCARHRLAVNEEARLVRCLKRCRRGGRHFDEVAQHIIVLHFQRLYSGRFTIACLQPGDHMARLIAQRTVLVEIGGKALLHEVTVTRKDGQVHIECCIEFAGQIKVAPAQRLADRVEVFRQPADGDAGAQPVRKVTSDHQRVANPGKVARAAAGYCNAPQGALKVRHGGKQLANVFAKAGIGDEVRHVVQPIGNGVGIAQRVRKT